MTDTQIHLGASWYPEMWPDTEWPKDIARMREVGFTLMRLFEFAWKRFEPQEGVYEFEWALRVLDQLHAAGIQVMVGTPTAAPPAWLTATYPEVLLTKANGTVAEHGKRKHYNVHSKKYRELCVRMVEKMVEVLGDHPAVHSWQIDNEMSEFDYGPESKRAFHAWLERKYGTVEKLNETWGLQFWSQAYDDFTQIPLCTASVGSIEVPERNHPSLIMAIAHFQNDGWADFMQAQIEVIRAKCPHPITTNMTGLTGSIKWSEHFQMMDRAGVSAYSDLDHMENNTAKMDRLRPMKSEVPYWLLETAPNWSGGGPVWNIHHEERGIRVYTWLSILSGGSMVLYWQWRSHWAGQEMQHGTCVGAAGQWRPGKETWTQLSREFAKTGEWLLAHPAARGPLAVMTSNENAWLFAIDPIHPDNRYEQRILHDYYKPLRDAQLQCDLINPATPLDDYQVLVCPHMSILPDETRKRIADWVKAGGRLILGPLTGTRTEEMTAWTDRVFGGLEDMMGADSCYSFSPHWMEERSSVDFADGTSCCPRIWCESFRPREGSEVLATYRGGYGDGQAAVIKNRFGKGKVITVGTPLGAERFLHLVRQLNQECGLGPLVDAKPGVRVCPRVDSNGKLCGLGLVNTTRERQRVTLPADGRCIFTDQVIHSHLHLEGLEVRIVVL